MTNTTNQRAKTYNGHPSWAHWNVSLWVNSSIGLYRLAYHLALQYGEEKAAHMLAVSLEGLRTPDGAPFTEKLLRHAIRGIAE